MHPPGNPVVFDGEIAVQAGIRTLQCVASTEAFLSIGQKKYLENAASLSRSNRHARSLSHLQKPFTNPSLLRMEFAHAFSP